MLNDLMIGEQTFSLPPWIVELPVKVDRLPKKSL